MAKVKIRVTDEDIESASGSGDFDLPPTGFYTAELVKCEPGFKKTEGGGEDKTAPRIECTYKLTGEGRDGKALPEGKNYGQFWDYVTFSEAAGWKRAEFLKAMGKPPAKAGEFELDTDECVGKVVVVRIKHEKDNRNEGEKRARISNVYPFVDADAEEAFGASSASDDADEDGDSPFAGDDGDDGDEELLTKEELEAMETKELGAVAKDFDIDPNEFVHKVRGKTKVKTAELIEAILEAQGDDDGDAEDGASEDDDESPF